MNQALPQRDGPCLRWNADAEPKAPMLLLHGFMDAAGSWDLVAPRLAAAGHPVFALDLRGHGQGHRADPHDYYHFPDYLLDIDRLLGRVAELSTPFVLVGHSMGGMVGTLFAGTFPERVSHFVNIEGLGPPETDLENNPERMRLFVEGVRKIRLAPAAPPATRSEMLRRLELAHPGVPTEVLASRLVHLAENVGEDAWVWRYDPLHRTRGPFPFRVSTFERFGKNVSAKVLYVSGGKNGFTVTGAEQRKAAFADRTDITFEGAGHMLHWTRPAELAEAIVQHARR